MKIVPSYKWEILALWNCIFLILQYFHILIYWYKMKWLLLSYRKYILQQLLYRKPSKLMPIR